VDDVQWPSRCSIFNSLASLADIEFQKATWLDPEMQNPHFTYVEFVECFYDACSGDWRVSDKNAPSAPFASIFAASRIDEAERDLLWDVHLALRADVHPDDYDHPSILSSESWARVVGAAERAVQQLRSSLTDPKEREALENILPSPEEKRWP
jgi:hypothetical protein